GSAFVLVVTVMMLQSYSTIPQYKTRARLEIQDPRSISLQNVGISDARFWESSDIYYATQDESLRSRELARRVVQKLQLQNHPDFNGSRPQPRDPVALVRQARASASAWVRSLVARPSQAPQSTTKPAPNESDQEGRYISAFLAGLTIGRQRDTQIFNIDYVHTDPAFATAAANTIAEEYVKQNVTLRLDDTQQQLTFVTEELVKAEARRKDAEQALVDYRSQNNAMSLQERQNIVVSGLNDAASQLTRARASRLQKESEWRQLERLDPGSPAADGLPAIATNVAVVRARGELASLESKKKGMIDQGMGEGLPAVQAITVDISNAREILIAERRKVIEAARSEFQTAQNLEQSYASQLAGAKAQTEDLDSKSAGYKNLEDRATAEREAYQGFLNRKKELDILASSRANNARLMDAAEVPGAPFAPNSKKDLLSAILAGLTLAFMLAFGIEYLDDTIKTPEDVTKRLKLPLLGLVPAVRGDHVPMLTETVPHDFGEAFRSLRTSLVFTSGGESTRVIAVTSSQPLEGKTTTAANLAFALALGGSRVILIDADMRRPGLHKAIGLQNGLGLSHLLTGQSRVRDVVQRTSEPNLFAITAGRTPPNPSELLASDRMNSLLANLAQGPFDWVVIDTPPVLAVTDAVIIAQKVAGVVFVIGSEMTRRVHAERALETLQSGRARSIGVVLNRVDFNRNKYYYSRYYGYQYKSYYGQNTPA
ncbi:MAG TPA: polysaccharide biosynthesis tyrosine autokinase, partial [Vicinamibacterales bacterium]|nr:polysaccharide biosynthesis tyrosine autokinase [Vicinamibacterales bacterium]